ncbi:MAG: PQQ-like beta-propeller repeat protein [Deltaproteobacteria bacterium]|nr:PQQ-like beta-propeller repeat protein [Deltaproteobacteria bacterium]
MSSRACFLFVLLSACAPGGDDDDDDDESIDGGGQDASLDLDAGTDAHVMPDAAPVEDDVLVWAHSADTLFSFEPRTDRVTSIGPFRTAEGDAAPQMTDLAVDSAGELYACSNDALFAVDPETATTTWITDFDVEADVRFYGLTFLPEGVLDPGVEVLVGATSNGDYYRIDESTGATELIGRFSDDYGLSGDIVSVEDAGTFATVKRDDLDTDVLVQLDPESGEVDPIGTGIGFTNLFGLAYFRQRLYGFSSRGELIWIDIDTGEGSIVTDETGSDQFWGAGVTTIAPTGPF